MKGVPACEDERIVRRAVVLANAAGRVFETVIPSLKMVHCVLVAALLHHLQMIVNPIMQAAQTLSNRKELQIEIVNDHYNPVG